MSNQNPKKQVPGQELMQMMQEIYGDLHTYQQVDCKTFRHLDQKFYQNTQKILETLGFRCIADIEDVTLSQTEPFRRLFIRVLLSNDGTTTGSCYHFAGSWLQRIFRWLGLLYKGDKQIALESELSDGSFLVTGNTLGMGLAPVPSVNEQQFPYNTSIETLWTRHREKLLEYSQQRIHPVKVNNYDEIEAAQHRLQMIKNNYRQSVGFLTEADIDKGVMPHQREAAEILKQSIRDMKSSNPE
jgi:hypothetical protein